MLHASTLCISLALSNSSLQETMLGLPLLTTKYDNIVEYGLHAGCYLCGVLVLISNFRSKVVVYMQKSALVTVGGTISLELGYVVLPLLSCFRLFLHRSEAT